MWKESWQTEVHVAVVGEIRGQNEVTVGEGFYKTSHARRWGPEVEAEPNSLGITGTKKMKEVTVHFGRGLGRWDSTDQKRNFI